MEITTVGLDLAKHVFQVHAVDAEGHVVVRKTLRRAQMMPFFQKLPHCLIGIEACGTSHHWARELIALGHDVRLMPPAYVKPYVKRGNTDAADAEAICEAVTRPMMRFVAVKSRDQQAIMSLHGRHGCAEPTLWTWDNPACCRSGHETRLADAAEWAVTPVHDGAG